MFDLVLLRLGKTTCPGWYMGFLFSFMSTLSLIGLYRMAVSGKVPVGNNHNSAWNYGGEQKLFSRARLNVRWTLWAHGPIGPAARGRGWPPARRTAV